MLEGARIERLCIKAQGRRGVPLVQSTVEDAFRTQLSAAGPAVQRGLLVIRKIDLGPIASRTDQATVNRRLAAMLRDAVRQAGPFDPARADAGDAVLFPDPLFPFVHLARRIASGRTIPQSWPWRAVLGETLFASRGELAAELVIRQLEAAQAGPAVRAILRVFGAALPEVASSWSAPMCTRVMAAMCVGAGHAGRRPITVLEMSNLSEDLWTLTDSAPFQSLWRRLQRETAFGSQILPLSVALHLGPDSRPVAARRAALTAALLEQLVKERVWGKAQRPQLRELAELVEVQSTALRKLPGGFSPEMTTAQLAKVLATAFIPAEGKQASKAVTLPEVAQRTTSERLEIEPPPSELEVGEAPLADFRHSAFEPTRHAGIAYLIALIQRSYGRWLNRGEHLLAGTGQRLLAQVLRRFALHPEDPVLCFLNGLGDMHQGEEVPMEFYLADEMLGEASRPIRVAPIAGNRGWRMASSGRVVVACWQGPAPREIRRLLKGRPRVERASAAPWSSVAMLASCEIGLRRYLRNGPKLRMAQLVRRHGELAHTATHLDISFDALVIDLAVRRWALDLSPGWCPWLWRVVTIHYDFGETDAG